MGIPQLTLSTGTPLMGPDGSLDGFRVEDGTVSIQGQGLEAKQSDYTAILARAVTVQGAIKAGKTLQVITGAQQIGLNAAQEATPLGALLPSGPSPAFGLDVAHLGGMYAGKIWLVATEAGVGVRLSGRLEAKDALSVTSAGAIHIDGAQLTSLDPTLKKLPPPSTQGTALTATGRPVAVLPQICLRGRLSSRALRSP
jgi:filamentous hemagglutinin